MSCQMIIATPYHYYRHFLQLRDPSVGVDELFHCLQDDSELTLERDDSDRRFFCSDLPSKYALQITRLLFRHAPEFGLRTDGDIYLPGSFEIRKSVQLTHYIEAGIHYVVSTKSFLDRVEFVETNLAKWVVETEATHIKAVLEIYRQGIRSSDKEKQPIFFSY